MRRYDGHRPGGPPFVVPRPESRQGRPPDRAPREDREVQRQATRILIRAPGWPHRRGHMGRGGRSIRRWNLDRREIGVDGHPRGGEVAAIPAGATIVGGPTVLGPTGPDPGRAARRDGIPAATRHIRTVPAGTDIGILGRRARRRQPAIRLIPAASNVAGMWPRPDVAV
jgi:hypothetical protein